MSEGNLVTFLIIHINVSTFAIFLCLLAPHFWHRGKYKAAEIWLEKCQPRLKLASAPPTWLFRHHHPGGGVRLPALAHHTFSRDKKKKSFRNSPNASFV